MKGKGVYLPVLMLLLGLPSPVRPASEQRQQPVAVCVVAPRVESVDDLDALGVVPLPRPQLVVVEPLLELRIQRQGRPTWQMRGSQALPIGTPLNWPTAPIAPGELVLLQLRPIDAPEETFAHVHLAGASDKRMEDAQALIKSLGQLSEAWLNAFERALDSDDVALAWGLLFHPEAPAASELVALREEVVRRGCQD